MKKTTFVVEIKKNISYPDPIFVDFTQHATDGSLSISIHAQPHSKAQIIVNINSNRQVNHTSYNETITIIAEKGSSVECITIQDLDLGAKYTQKHDAQVHADANVQWIDLCLGSTSTTSKISSSLLAPGASTTNTSLYLSSRNQHFDIFTESRHLAQDTQSHIISKGVVTDNGQVTLPSMIYISPEAHNCVGYEKQDVLVLSDKAKTKAIPKLEINNHNVKCSHGSTIGQIDKDVLFYFQSRGYNSQQAYQKIIEGYFMPVVEKLDNEHSRHSIYMAILDTIGTTNATHTVSDNIHN